MNGTRVAGEVFVVDGAGEEVSDCFLPTVRVVREAGAGVDGEVVEHEEGGEGAEGWGADGAADGGACAFGLGACEEGGGEGTGGHFWGGGVGGRERGVEGGGSGGGVERGGGFEAQGGEG